MPIYSSKLSWTESVLPFSKISKIRVMEKSVISCPYVIDETTVAVEVFLGFTLLETVWEKPVTASVLLL